ncbi:hypothetical protein LWI29_013316 [Acer saccharum]|uniref:Uncharacterized protein n=1 Tax=Acer saccharum TaxID=4024 RepID=A0AA39SIL4_ACESA|nr:hypothetical protein LWI29_013316 [Acer saccharum]
MIRFSLGDRDSSRYPSIQIDSILLWKETWLFLVSLGLEEVLVARKEWEMEEQRRQIASRERAMAVADRGLVGNRDQRSKERRSFIVADTETVMLKVKDKEKRDIYIQVPYAVGFLVVNPGVDVGAMPDHSCETYFSEDYSSFIDDFQEKSNQMMFDFLERLSVVI